MATLAGRLMHPAGAWKFALPLTAAAAGVIGLTLVGYAIATGVNRSQPPILPPAIETATPTPATPTPTQAPSPKATPEVSVEVWQAVYQNSQLSVTALLRNNSRDYAANGVDVLLTTGTETMTVRVPFIQKNTTQPVSFNSISFTPGQPATIEAKLTSNNEVDANLSNNTVSVNSIIYIQQTPTPTPTRTPTKTPTPKPTPTPEQEPTPTYTPKPATPTPTRTPKPPTPTPTPSLEQITATTLEGYMQKDTNFKTGLVALNDYDVSFKEQINEIMNVPDDGFMNKRLSYVNQLIAERELKRDNVKEIGIVSKLPSYQRLTALAGQDFELVKRAVVAASALNEFGLTKGNIDASGTRIGGGHAYAGLRITSETVIQSIELVYEYHAKYGKQDPTGFASMPDLAALQLAISQIGSETLPNGTTILSTPENRTALIIAADILAKLLLPDEGLNAVPQAAIAAYCNTLEPCKKADSETSSMTGGQQPYTFNASTDPRFSLWPITKDDEGVQRVSPPYEDHELALKMQPLKEQWLQMINTTPNTTAPDLEALAAGNLDKTTVRLEAGEQYHTGKGWERYTIVITERIKKFVNDKAKYVNQVSPDTHQFMAIAKTQHGDDGLIGRFSKGRELLALNDTNVSVGPFRGLDGTSGPGSNRNFIGNFDGKAIQPIFVIPNQEQIIVLAEGVTFRKNSFRGDSKSGKAGIVDYQKEMWGCMRVTPETANRDGNYTHDYGAIVTEDGSVVCSGEPGPVPILPLSYPFIDKQATHERWVNEWKNKPRTFVKVKDSYGVNFLYLPAMVDEGNPMELVFDNRSGEPVDAGDSVTKAVFKPSETGLLMPNYDGFNLGYFGSNGFTIRAK